MAAAFLPRGLNLRFPQGLTSAAYVHMTRHMLDALGVQIHDDCGHGIQVEAAHGSKVGLRGFESEIEPDASGATYFWAAAALVPAAKARVPGLCFGCLQGDWQFTTLLETAGAACVTESGARERFSSDDATLVRGGPIIVPADADLEQMPDTAMTAAAVACFASPTPENPTATTTLRGLKTLRVKETDRLAALQTELSKLGAQVEIITARDDEALQITPPPDLAVSPLCLPESVAPPAPIEFDTYDDHRMAMSLALIGLRRGNIIIRDPACVRKTYPTFWRDLAKLYQ